MTETVALGNIREATAFAPASVGNVAVGFDVMGHAIQGVGDTVRVVRSDHGIRLAGVTGLMTELPESVSENTATAAVAAMAQALGLESGFDIHIDKGIPLGSGLGGSAASAVAAVVAVNHMLKIPVTTAQLYPWALAGEMAASGSEHGDNVAASLLGGLALVGPSGLRKPMQVPTPGRLRCVVVHPALQIETRSARVVLPKQFDRDKVVAQSANLAAFIAACVARDIEVIGDTLRDLLIEPIRARSIPGFDAAKAAALDAGALGCSISGSGPSVFAWFEAESAAAAGGEAMAEVFRSQGLETRIISSPVSGPGARLVNDHKNG